MIYSDASQHGAVDMSGHHSVLFSCVSSATFHGVSSFPVFYMGLLSHWFVFLSLSRERGRTIPGHARCSGAPALGPEAQQSVPDHLLPDSLW